MGGSVLYAFGNAYGTNVYTVHKYNPTSGSSTGQYMTPTDFPGLLPEVYDIAYSSSGVWVARDESDSPVLCFNTSGVLTNYIMGTTVPAAAGLAMDPEGFLWVSDPVNEKIYKVDITTSISETTAGCFGQGSIHPLANPFNTIAVIEAASYPSGSSVEIFDIRGRLVHTGSVIDGIYSWNALSEPSGTYMIRVSNAGDSETLRLIKTDS